MRLFLAVELSEELLNGLETVQERLRVSAPDAEVRWSSREHFHLTVLFLGELSEDTLPAIHEMCGTIASETLDFRIRLAGGSAFPKPATGKPLKTLWVGLTEGAEAWKELALRAEPWFAPLGVPRSDGLVPHVTLGRVKSESASLRSALESEGNIEVGAQQAGSLSLIQSVLTPEGAHYTQRGRWNFSPE